MSALAGAAAPLVALLEMTELEFEGGQWPGWLAAVCARGGWLRMTATAHHAHARHAHACRPQLGAVSVNGGPVTKVMQCVVCGRSAAREARPLMTLTAGGRYSPSADRAAVEIPLSCEVRQRV